MGTTTGRALDVLGASFEDGTVSVHVVVNVGAMASWASRHMSRTTNSVLDPGGIGLVLVVLVVLVVTVVTIEGGVGEEAVLALRLRDGERDARQGAPRRRHGERRYRWARRWRGGDAGAAAAWR